MIDISWLFIVFCWCQHNFWVSKRVFITFFAAKLHWENHFVVRLLLVFHNWTRCIDDNFWTLQTRKTPTCHATKKTIFLNFYKTKDYFFWLDNKSKRPLHTIYLFLRNSRSMPPEVFFKKDKYLFRRTPLGDCFWNIWKCSPLLFCHFTIFLEAVPQRNCRSSVPDVFFKKIEHLLGRTYLGNCFWNFWNISLLFSVCSVLLLPTSLADIFQVLFTYWVITVFATHFDFGECIFIFFILFLSSYFFNATVTTISVTSILHTNVCCCWWLCYLQNFTHFCYYCLL